ncbi:CheR family methyltransferase [Sphingomonas sp.]|uniref:CheR family methyltransferase n=1 Tax=Sphingomonas sp. TaxID=28214 RepID=UPI003AFFD6C1
MDRYQFGAGEHAAIARLAFDEAGIVLAPNKAQLVYGRLARLVRACGLDSFADYVVRIEEDADERARAVDALTTNHTGFFRESHHFDHFVAEVWPTLRRRLAEGGRVRLWSAACSSGEEPYTFVIAALGREKGLARELASRDFRVLATDLSQTILTAARAGRYPQDVASTIPAALRALWTEPTEDGFAIAEGARAPIAFRPLNLLRPWPMRNRFDAIFCRNVMIYFDEATKARLQARLADQLAPGGFLYIGHSERLAADVAPRFASIGRTIYRKVDA